MSCNHWSRKASTTSVSMHPSSPRLHFGPGQVCSMVNILRPCPILQCCALIYIYISPRFGNFTKCLRLLAVAGKFLLSHVCFAGFGKKLITHTFEQHHSLSLVLFNATVPRHLTFICCDLSCQLRWESISGPLCVGATRGTHHFPHLFPLYQCLTG